MEEDGIWVKTWTEISLSDTLVTMVRSAYGRPTRQPCLPTVASVCPTAGSNTDSTMCWPTIAHRVSGGGATATVSLKYRRHNPEAIRNKELTPSCVRRCSFATAAELVERGREMNESATKALSCAVATHEDTNGACLPDEMQLAICDARSRKKTEG